MEKKPDRKLILEDGSVYEGFGFGSRTDRFAEIVFNTSMVGYQEIISDPSYTDQAVVMTYPAIGNYGICADDFESDVPKISGLIVRNCCTFPSNFRCGGGLEATMEKYGIAGISGIDTRMLTRHIRDFGSIMGLIADAEKDNDLLLEMLHDHVPKTDQVKRAGTDRPYEFGSVKTSKNTKPIVVIDCGIKKNILRMMSAYGLPLIVVPWDTNAQTIMGYDPAGVFISNGPGNPEDCVPAIMTIKELKGKLPIFGICLGHQIICLAYGAKTYKLKFGHRGGNHPVKNLSTGKIEITSQNHSYAVVPSSLEGTGLTVTHVNLLDDTVEGVECRTDRLFSVQYHPESAPGPCDSAYLFDRFFRHIIPSGMQG
ncbi:MAG: glutamine-hydrolyzing carbamoyl-phosphate synthase small subunit [Lachnospiraceae bacterium]|nr:glutamine-hydrolyzing carbamoyl-phosphate synthase small subunit [Lachnospiraceae bacterium]